MDLISSFPTILQEFTDTRRESTLLNEKHEYGYLGNWNIKLTI